MPTRNLLLTTFLTSLGGSLLFVLIASLFVSSLTGWTWLLGAANVTTWIFVLMWQAKGKFLDKKLFTSSGGKRKTGTVRDEELKYRPNVEQLSLVASSTHSAVIFTDLDGRITWVNAGFSRISGYGLEEARGRKPGDFLQGPQTDGETVFKIRNALSKKEGIRTEILNYSKTGKVYWLDMEIMPLRNEDNDVVGFMSVQSEITALKHAIDAQQDAALQMKTILDHAPMVVFMKDADGKYLFFNEKYKNAVGRPDLQAGMTDRDIFDETFAAICKEKDRQIMKGEKIVQYEMQVGGRDFFELKFPIRNQQNAVYAVGGISLDVTESRAMQNALAESELKFRLITEAAPVYIWMTDREGKPTFFNRQWLNFVGRSHEDAVMMDWRENIHSDDLEKCKSLFNLSHAAQQELNTIFRFKNKDGIYRWLQLKAVPRRNSENEFTGFIGSSVDVTEQVEIKNKLEQLLEEKEFLIREIHHRVKNNLQVMSSVLFLKAQTLKDPAMRLLLAQSRQRLRSMALIHETLMQSGSQVTKIDIRNYLLGLIHDQQQALSVDPEFIKVEADIDSQMMNIEQVVNVGFIINETFTNAVKYAFPVQQTGKVEISFKIKGDTHLLTVKDNGVGLPPHVSLNNSDLFGIQLVKIFANHLQAQLTLEGTNGTTWSLKF